MVRSHSPDGAVMGRCEPPLCPRDRPGEKERFRLCQRCSCRPAACPRHGTGTWSCEPSPRRPTAPSSRPPPARRSAPAFCNSPPGPKSRRAGAPNCSAGEPIRRPANSTAWPWCCCGSSPAPAGTSPTSPKGPSPTGATPTSTAGSARSSNTCATRVPSPCASARHPPTGAGTPPCSSRSPVRAAAWATSSPVRSTRSARPSPSGCGPGAGAAAAVTVRARTGTLSPGTSSMCRSPDVPPRTCGPGSTRSGGATSAGPRRRAWRWWWAVRPNSPISTGCWASPSAATGSGSVARSPTTSVSTRRSTPRNRAG